MTNIASPVWDNDSYPINADHYQPVTWSTCDQYSYSQYYCMNWSPTTCYHPGIDVGLPWGTPLKAIAAGTAIVAGADGCTGKGRPDCRWVRCHLATVNTSAPPAIVTS